VLVLMVLGLTVLLLKVWCQMCLTEPTRTTCHLGTRTFSTRTFSTPSTSSTSSELRYSGALRLARRGRSR
jgi:hypothetical protein